KPFHLSHPSETLKRLRLYPPNPVASQPEAADDLLDRVRLAAVDPVAKLHDLALLRRKLLDRLPQLLLSEVQLDQLVELRFVAHEQVTEGGVLGFADGFVETGDRASGGSDLFELFPRELRRFRKLLVRRRAAKRRAQRPLRTVYPPLSLNDVDRHPDLA